MSSTLAIGDSSRNHRGERQRVEDASALGPAGGTSAAATNSKTIAVLTRRVTGGGDSRRATTKLWSSYVGRCKTALVSGCQNRAARAGANKLGIDRKTTYWSGHVAKTDSAAPNSAIFGPGKWV
nr:hypothetical protein [Micromonospora purpureochromogenes]